MASCVTSAPHVVVVGINKEQAVSCISYSRGQSLYVNENIVFAEVISVPGASVSSVHNDQYAEKTGLIPCRNV
jgi:hypothetical protein